MNLPHPNKTIITREQMAALDQSEWLVQRKFDGELSVKHIHSGNLYMTILGERMKERSGGLYTHTDLSMFHRHGEWFAAFTVAEVHGANVLSLPTRDRWTLLMSALLDFPPDMELATSVYSKGMITDCFDAGAEGVVAHKWDSPWGNMLCCKQGWLGVCRVFGLVPGSQSVFIVDAGTGQARGKLKVGLKNVRVGSLIRVEALSVHESGALREAKLCTNWLVEY